MNTNLECNQFAKSYDSILFNSNRLSQRKSCFNQSDISLLVHEDIPNDVGNMSPSTVG